MAWSNDESMLAVGGEAGGFHVFRAPAQAFAQKTKHPHGSAGRLQRVMSGRLGGYVSAVAFAPRAWRCGGGGECVLCAGDGVRPAAFAVDSGQRLRLFAFAGRGTERGGGRGVWGWGAVFSRGRAAIDRALAALHGGALVCNVSGEYCREPRCSSAIMSLAALPDVGRGGAAGAGEGGARGDAQLRGGAAGVGGEVRGGLVCGCVGFTVEFLSVSLQA